MEVCIREFPFRDKGMKMRKLLLFCLVLFWIAAPGAPVSLASEPPDRNVLLLHSYHQGLDWTDKITEGIESVLKGKGSHAVLRVEYMDAKHVNDPKHYRTLYELYKRKFANSRFDVIISSDDDAFNFLLKHRQDLFPGTPVVFCGVNYFRDSMLAGPDGFTGVVESFDVKRTLDVALKAHPDARYVYVYVDNTATGIANRKISAEALVPYNNRVRGVFLENLNLKETREKGLCLPPRSIALMMTIPSDRYGNVSEENLRDVSDRCDVPIYSVWDFFLGRGIVGGMITSGFSQGEAAGKLALRILNGEKAGSIPVVKESPNRWMFDYAQMQRFGIKRGNLPEGSVFINAPYSLYRERPGYVWGFAIVVAVLASIIAVMLTSIFRRRRAEEATRETNLRLQTLIQAIPDIVIFKDCQRRHLVVNRACERITGRSQDEIIGKTDAELLPPDLAEYCRKSDEEVLSKGEIIRSEERVTHDDGVTAFFDTIKAPLYDGKGNILGLVGVSRDITELKRGEGALRESEERYRTLVETSPDAIVRFDPVGKVLMANRQSARMLGYESAEEFPGRSMFEFIAPEDHEKTAGDLKRLLETGSVPLLRYTLIRKDGTRFPVESSGTIVTDGEGKTGSIVVVVRDITEKDTLEKQLFQAMKMEAVGRLAGGLAHDINNYLGAITGFSDLVKITHGKDQALAKRMDSIAETAIRASSLIRQLLAFSRRQPSVPEVLNLNAVIEGMESMMRRLIGEDVRLATRLAGNPWNVKTDPSQVEQILVNLLVNARDAMPQGGELTIETANVEFNAGESGIPGFMKPGRYLMLAVSDTGTGIPEKILEKIFEPFFTTKDMGKGSGLGLSTVYGIVKQHDGYIQVHNRPTKGAVFRIYFPACEDRVDLSAASPDLPPHARQGSEKVLFVEDNDDVRESTTEILAALGYDVLAASSGEEALLLFEKQREEIDLLITDVVMPGMGGKMLADRASRMKKNLKVLFVSGYPEEVIATHGVLQKGIHYLQKPFSVSGFSVKIRELLD
jgi:PAS domain S-box-containing protein